MHGLLKLYSFIAVYGHGLFHAAGTLSDNEKCSYSFNVWHPDEDIKDKVKYLELQFSNVSSHMEKRLMEIRQEVYLETTRFLSMNVRGGRRHKSKVRERDLNNGVSGFQRELNDMVKRLNHLTSDYVHLRHRMRTSSATTTTTSTTPAPTTPAIQKMQQLVNSNLIKDERNMVSMSMLEGYVNELKGEWIIMKRDLIHLKSENSELKHAQNTIRNESVRLNHTIGNLQSRMLGVSTPVEEQKEGGQAIFAQTEISPNEVTDIDEDHREMSSRLSGIGEDLDDLAMTVRTLTGNMDLLKKDNGYLKRMALENKNKMTSGGVLTAPHIDTVADSAQSLRRTILRTPTDCQDLYDNGFDVSGVYQIKPNGKLVQDDVYCQFINNTAYTVIQRRIDGLLNFNRRWIEYKFGFGNQYGEHWLGNEFIHFLSQQKNYVLRIDMWDWEGNQAYAEYDNFRLGGVDTDYTLHIGDYRGNAGDSLSYHNRMKFSTEDVDNDLHMRKCAAENKAGWWFNTCLTSNLNGIYRVGWYSQSKTSFSDGIIWYTLRKSEFYSLRKVEMKLRRSG